MNLDKRIANAAKDATWGMAKKRESVSIERERELIVWCSARGPRCERCTSYRWEALVTLWWQKEDAANTFRSRPLHSSEKNVWIYFLYCTTPAIKKEIFPNIWHPICALPLRTRSPLYRNRFMCWFKIFYVAWKWDLRFECSACLSVSFNEANVGSYGTAISREVKLAHVTSLRKV